MSISTNNTPRIVRGKPPKRTFTDHTYRKALPYLMRDFQRRCAYSQQHTDRSLGVRTMEVDHFNPKLRGKARNRYENLFLGTRHCNGSKSRLWPSSEDRRRGIYIINPCEEMDYGKHIFEHPETHRLVGVTPAGDFHITACDLNAYHLVDERRERAAIYDLLNKLPITVKGTTSLLPQFVQSLDLQLLKMIPMIPYLPASHPKYEDELLLFKLMTSTT